MLCSSVNLWCRWSPWTLSTHLPITWSTPLTTSDVMQFLNILNSSPNNFLCSSDILWCGRSSWTLSILLPIIFSNPLTTYDVVEVFGPILLSIILSALLTTYDVYEVLEHSQIFCQLLALLLWQFMTWTKSLDTLNFFTSNLLYSFDNLWCGWSPWTPSTLLSIVYSAPLTTFRSYSFSILFKWIISVFESINQSFSNLN